MPVLPKHKWSLKFDQCIKCQTASKKGKHRHCGKGKCVSCMDKERYKRPQRKEEKRIARDKWLAKMVGTPEYIEMRRVRSKGWRSTTKYRWNLYKRYQTIRIQRFLNSGKVKEDCLKIVCECCNKQVPTPFSPQEIEDNMTALNLFREKLKQKHLTAK